MVSIETYTPRHLAGYIRSFWCLEVLPGPGSSYKEEILPDGHQEIIFNINLSPVRKRNGSDDWINDPAVFFSGQNRKSYTIELHPGTIIYGIRFYPHTQSLFYHFPASLSTDSLIALDEVSSRDRLTGCIAETPAKTFTRLEQEFTRRMAGLAKPVDTFRYIDAAVRRIMQDKGTTRVLQLEKLTGVSARHLEKSFQKYVGISPKQFCSIIRYGHFINYRKKHPGKTLTECAYEADFNDQSHLVRLANLLTGQSPKAYFNRPHLINDVFLEA